MLKRLLPGSRAVRRERKLIFKFTKKLRCKASAQSRERGRSKRMSECSWRIARDAVEPADLISGAPVQAPPVGARACLGAEPHAPIAPGDETKFFAAMVAAQRHDPRLHALGDGARNPIAATELLKATL
jgi:hypothetical protein